jgi:hypothetical protein
MGQKFLCLMQDGQTPVRLHQQLDSDFDKHMPDIFDVSE